MYASSTIRFDDPILTENAMRPSAIDRTQRSFAIRTSIVALLMFAAGLAPSPCHAEIEVNVTHVGFPTIKLGDVVRSGQWIPITVDVALVNQPTFSGSMRVGQLDVDGDECYDIVPVHLMAESGGSKRYYLYALPNPHTNEGRFFVELFDTEGNAVEVISAGESTFKAAPAQLGQAIDDNMLLILSISDGAIGGVREIVDHPENYSRAIAVSHISPRDLPDHWIGLEAVDYIVWDDARAEQLREKQLHALGHWVRQGGTLLLAASRSAGALTQVKSIAEILPVDLGAIRPITSLPKVRRKLLEQLDSPPVRPGSEDAQWWNDPFPSPVPFVDCTLRDGAVDVADPRNETGEAVIASRSVGRGRVIFSGITLADLFSAPSGKPAAFFRNVFGLRVLGQDAVAPTNVSLFGFVVSAVAFARSGMFYLMLAGAFSVLYVVASTFGTWTILGGRGWRRHCWTAFAAVAGGASLLSVIAVNAIRGFGGETLRQISVVDVDAGGTQGFARVFFGFKTGLDRRMNLWLPSDPIGETKPGASECFLRPLPIGSTEFATGSFADPQEYRLIPGSGVLEGVRIRATLKRFEGRWDGPIQGSVTGKVVLRGTSLVANSYLTSDLGVDLTDCYLLQPTLRVDNRAGPRNLSINVFSLGIVPGDGTRIDLLDRCYPISPETGEPTRVRPKLGKLQRSWESNFRSLVSGFGYGGSDAPVVEGQEKNALLLMSTIGDYEPVSGAIAQLRGPEMWSLDRLRQLDLRDQLQPGWVYLIGFADDPGPVRLFSQSADGTYRKIEPDALHSWTMYRIRIPVARVGGGDEEDETEPIQ